MLAYYDFHIHSALSPCADNDMTPCSIVAMASIKKLDVIAISDHNSIKNVKVAIECGEAFGVLVVPSMEIQSSEDIHIITLFRTFEDLQNFYDNIEWQNVKNRVDIFGEQLIIDEDDNIVGTEDRLLLTSCSLSAYSIIDTVYELGGIPIPAHIDREANGMLAILGEIPPDIDAKVLEFSPYATQELKQKYQNYACLTSSDSHHLIDISENVNTLKVERIDIDNVFKAINERR